MTINRDCSLIAKKQFPFISDNDGFLPSLDIMFVLCSTHSITSL